MLTYIHHLYTHPTIHLFTLHLYNPPTINSIHPSNNPSIYTSTHIISISSIHQSIHSSIHLDIPLYPSICVSIHPTNKHWSSICATSQPLSHRFLLGVWISLPQGKCSLEVSNESRKCKVEFPSHFSVVLFSLGFWPLESWLL
jgi:hypothetical protein